MGDFTTAGEVESVTAHEVINKNSSEWKVRPTNEKKKKLKKKLSEYLKRGKAAARPLAVTIKRVNEIVRGF